MGNPFSGETITQVSSVIYNLAGDTTKLSSFIKKTVFQSVYLVKNPTISKDISTAILSSKGFNLRSYIYWLNNTKQGTRYKELIGYDSVEVSSSGSFDKNSLAIYLKGDTATLRKSRCTHLLDAAIRTRKYSWWGGIYLASEYPGEELYSFSTSVSGITNDTQTMTVTVYVDEHTTHLYTVTLPFTLNNGDILPLCKKGVKYLYAQWQYILAQDTDINNIPDSYEAELAAWQALVDQAESEGTGYPAPPLPPLPEEGADTRYLLYEYNSGNSELDAFFSNSSSITTEFDDAKKFAPPIPFRLDNLNLSEIFADNRNFDQDLKNKIQDFKNSHNMAEIEELYKLNKKAYQKVYGLNAYKDLDKIILDNQQLGDIDYAYLVFGVALNTPIDAGKRYLYTFFKELHNATFNSSNEKSIYLHANQNPLNFSFTITWSASDYHSHARRTELPAFARSNLTKKHKYSVGYKKQDVYTTYTTYTDNEPVEIQRLTKTDYIIYFAEYVDETYCNYLTFENLVHRNYVYDYEDVRTETKGIIFDPEDDDYAECSFLVPIHEGIFRSLPALVQAELGECFGYMVFNCYERKRLKWYQTKDFSSFFTWCSAVFTVATLGYGGLGNLIGAIQGKMAGATSATIAANIGKALINVAITAVAIKIVVQVLTPILGEKFANIAGSVIAFVAILKMNGVDFSNMFDALTKADNLIKLGLSTLDGYSKGIAAETQQIVRTGQQQLMAIQEQMKAFNEKYQAMYGETNMWANESFWFNLRTNLSPGAYFYVTLPRGAEIAERTLDYTVNYPEYSTRTYLATE